MSLHNGRMYLVVVDDTPDTHARSVPADHALDAARHVADALGFGTTLHESATALGRWTIATADEHRVTAWPAPWDGTIDDEARRIAANIGEFEANVLRSIVTNKPQRWGGAIGQAVEFLNSSGCITATFEAATDRGRAVIAALDEAARAKAIAFDLPDLERNVLRAVRNGPIMEADIGLAEPQVSALVGKKLLQWRPEGCVYTDLGELVARVFEKKAVTP